MRQLHVFSTVSPYLPYTRLGVTNRPVVREDSGRDWSCSSRPGPHSGWLAQELALLRLTSPESSIGGSGSLGAIFSIIARGQLINGLSVACGEPVRLGHNTHPSREQSREGRIVIHPRISLSLSLPFSTQPPNQTTPSQSNPIRSDLVHSARQSRTRNISPMKDERNQG